MKYPGQAKAAEEPKRRVPLRYPLVVKEPTVRTALTVATRTE